MGLLTCQLSLVEVLQRTEQLVQKVKEKFIHEFLLYSQYRRDINRYIFLCVHSFVLVELLQPILFFPHGTQLLGERSRVKVNNLLVEIKVTVLIRYPRTNVVKSSLYSYYYV